MDYEQEEAYWREQGRKKQKYIDELCLKALQTPSPTSEGVTK